MAEKFIIAVLTNPREGQDAAFTEWYDDRHIPDVLAIPGVISAQRYGLAPVQRMDAPYPFSWFAFYEVETDDLQALIKDMRERGGTERMPISDALDPNRITLVFSPHGPRRTPGDA